MRFEYQILGGLFALAVLLVGCGAGELSFHVEAARGFHDVRVETEPIIRRARIAAMTAEARRVHELGGSEAEARDAAEHESRRWECALSTHRLYGVAVATYVDELALASLAEDDDISLFDRVRPYIGRVVDTWRLTFSCVEELFPGALPGVPDILNLFPPSWNIEAPGEANGD